MTKLTGQTPPTALSDDALDQAQGGLGDTATHEVGHIRRPAPPKPGTTTAFTDTILEGSNI